MSRRGEGRRRKKQPPRRPGPHDHGKVAVRLDRLAESSLYGATHPRSSATFAVATEAKTIQFNDLLETVGARALLAGLSFYRFTRLGEEENRRQKVELRTEQFHAEILQALALARPDVWHERSVTRAQIDELQRLLHPIANTILPRVDDMEEFGQGDWSGWLGTKRRSSGTGRNPVNYFDYFDDCSSL